ENDGDGFAFFDHTEPATLQAGSLAGNGARIRHDLVDRLRRLGVRRKTRRRIHSLLGGQSRSMPGQSDREDEQACAAFHKSSTLLFSTSLRTKTPTSSNPTASFSKA